MASVLVGHSYFLAFDRKQLERAKPYPPLATIQAAALLRRAGHRVALFDAMLAAGTAEFEAELRRMQPDVVVLDIIVPGRDGFTLLNDLATRQMHDLPVFVMSGFGDRYLSSAARLGRVYGLNIAGEIPKPLNLDRLNDIFTPFKP